VPRSKWEAPPEELSQLGPGARQYLRDLHETVFGRGIGGAGALDGNNLAIDHSVTEATPSGKPPVLTADPTSGKVSTSSAGVPVGDLTVDSGAHGLVLGTGGAGKIASTSEASPLIEHTQTAGYSVTQHREQDDTSLYDYTKTADDPGNVKAGVTLWSAKQIQDYVGGTTGGGGGGGGSGGGSIPQGTLIGRYSSGTGSPEQVTIGTGLALSTSNLVATSTGGPILLTGAWDGTTDTFTNLLPYAPAGPVLLFHNRVGLCYPVTGTPGAGEFKQSGTGNRTVQFGLKPQTGDVVYVLPYLRTF